MAIRRIYETPDPVLRQISKPVETFDSALKALVADMFETMYEAPGIGLAAVQVGVPIRLLVIDLQEPEDPEDPESAPGPDDPEDESDEAHGEDRPPRLRVSPGHRVPREEADDQHPAGHHLCLTRIRHSNDSLCLFFVLLCAYLIRRYLHGKRRG